MKQCAEAFLNDEVTKAVINVPSSASQAERRAIKSAARIAGLQVLRLVSNSMAAAIALNLETGRFDEHNVLVCDIGAQSQHFQHWPCGSTPNAAHRCKSDLGV